MTSFMLYFLILQPLKLYEQRLFIKQQLRLVLLMFVDSCFEPMYLLFNKLA